jgi:hypothetical protein
MLSTQALKTKHSQINRITILNSKEDMKIRKPGQNSRPASFPVKPAVWHAKELIENLWFHPAEGRSVYHCNTSVRMALTEICIAQSLCYKQHY